LEWVCFAANAFMKEIPILKGWMPNANTNQLFYLKSIITKSFIAQNLHESHEIKTMINLFHSWRESLLWSRGNYKWMSYRHTLCVVTYYEDQNCRRPCLIDTLTPSSTQSQVGWPLWDLTFAIIPHSFMSLLQPTLF